ncbi:conserved protein of unknown function [Sterolibacterium denitrificans]|uniref:SnoaL-like domain-containing protein n=1 Tax=Sterolibacterium denitrificans TaxID=157592 RepID=A0A7Z7MV78_9PROT|nr:nuclear transport factor 2 family protein [Sterolibacterium denitrificans]SMB26537.1 conserved protein of unknown function [Sterolibacterium denitrificans]
MTISLQALSDRQAITDLIYSYCRSMDRMDRELGYSVWHEDGVADYGSIYCGSGRQFVDWVCEIHQSMTSHSHQISNILLQLNGDRAGSESYVTVALRFNHEGKLKQETVRGRYLDRWSRRNGQWGIEQRIFVVDFEEIREVATSSIEGWGRRDPADMSYDVLSLSGKR